MASAMTGVAGVEAASTPSGIGAARRRRAQAQRSQAKHVAWLAGLLQAASSHHTSSGAATPLAILEARLAALEAKVTGIGTPAKMEQEVMTEVEEKVGTTSATAATADESKLIGTGTPAQAGTASATAATTDETKPELISLKVQDQQDNVAQYSIKKSTPLHKLMDAYCKRRGLQASQVQV